MTPETEFATADSVILKVVKKWKIASGFKKRENFWITI